MDRFSASYIVAGVTAAALAGSADAALVNLMSNPGFESGLAGYTTSNGHFPPNPSATYTASATGTLVRSGAQSAELTVNNNNVGQPGLYLLYQDIDVSSYAVGETFTASGHAASSPTNPLADGPVLTSYIEWLDSGGGRVDIDFFGSAGVPPTSFGSATWTYSRTKDVATAVTARYFFGIENGAVPTGRGTAHFDDVSFSVEAVPEPASLALLGAGSLLMLRRRG